MAGQLSYTTLGMMIVHCHSGVDDMRQAEKAAEGSLLQGRWVNLLVDGEVA